MVQMVTLNELLPAVFRLLVRDENSILEYAQLRAINTLNYFEALFDDSPYFAGEQLTLAEIVAGTLVHRMPDLGIALTNYSKLNRWFDCLLARPTWQQIELSPEEWSSFKRRMRVIPKIWQRRRHQRINALSQQ
jgi:glutathione S-transferase